MAQKELHQSTFKIMDAAARYHLFRKNNDVFGGKWIRFSKNFA